MEIAEQISTKKGFSAGKKVYQESGEGRLKEERSIKELCCWNLHVLAIANGTHMTKL